MTFIFSPSLGETTNVTISDSHYQGDTVLLRFTAKLGEEDFKQIKKDGVRVQLWSDIPISGKSTPGEWQELDFDEIPNLASSPPVNPESISSGLTIPISLVDRSAKGVEEAHDFVERRLVAQAEIQAPPYPGGVRFSFTYRLLYPSNDVKWLGQFGYNGTVVVTRGASLSITLHDDWQTSVNGVSLELQSQTTTVINVAKLPNMGDFRVWTFGENIYQPSLIGKDANLLVFLPIARADSILQLPIYVFSASQGASVRALATGSIVATGSGSLLLQRCQSPTSLSNIIERALSHCSLEDTFLLSDPRYVLLSSIRNRVPVKMVLFPLNTQIPGPRSIDIGVSTLAEALSSSDTTQVSIFSPLNFDAHFVQAPFHGKAISFTTDLGGGEFVLSPVHDLIGSKPDGTHNNESTLKVSILSPYHSVVKVWETGRLPTPPPSPQLKPRRSQVTFASEHIIIPPSPDRNLDSQIRQRVIPKSEQPKTQPSAIHNNHPLQVVTPKGDILELLKAFYGTLILYIAVLSRLFWGSTTNKEYLNWEDEPFDPDSSQQKDIDEVQSPPSTPPSLIHAPQGETVKLFADSEIRGAGCATENEDIVRGNQNTESVPIIGTPSINKDASSQVIAGCHSAGAMSHSSSPSPAVLTADLLIDWEQNSTFIALMTRSSPKDNVNSALISRLATIIEYNGHTPEGLTVRKVKGVRGQVNGELDHGIDQWTFFLVEFYVSEQAANKCATIKVTNSGFED